MPVRPSRAIVALSLALSASAALAWGPDGHRTVGALAERLVGPHARAQVHALLGDLSLEQASVWADCAKGVDPASGFAYVAAGKYPECAIFETKEGEAAMIDFVRRNDTNCPRVPGDESCHKQYHYSDDAIQRRHYHLGDVGTRSFDVVAAIAAVTRVLKGEPAPPPFAIKDRREALLLLAHYVGDIEQPLHVGAVYLDASGQVVDPDAGGFDPATATQGGNAITTIRVAINRKAENLHATWDDIPASLQARHVDAAWIALARQVAPSQGSVYGWPAQWASATLTQARHALAGLRYGREQDGSWTVPIDGRYDDGMEAVKKRQLIDGGARLAQLLDAIWP